MRFFIWSLAISAISAELIQVSFYYFHGPLLRVLNMDFKEDQPAKAEQNNVQASKIDHDIDVQSAGSHERERRFISFILDALNLRRSFRRGYKKGRRVGYSLGISAGYKRGLSVGRSSGYKSGYASGRSIGFAAGAAAEKRKLSLKISSAYNRVKKILKAAKVSG